MGILTAIFLGFIQGLTEFLPISSSGHLFILEEILHLEIADNPFFDVVLHAGTLIALLGYFWKDWLTILKEAYSKRNNLLALASTKFGLIGIALVPLLLFGIPMKIIYPAFRTVTSVSLLFLLIGIILIAVSMKKFKKSPFTLKSAFLIGMAQVFAILPGISRSGITIATGISRGISKDEAARFSFLIAFPAILAATIISVMDVTVVYIQEIGPLNLLIGFAASFISSLFFVAFFLRFIRKYSLAIFGYYLVALSIVLLTYILW